MGGGARGGRGGRVRVNELGVTEREGGGAKRPLVRRRDNFL